MKRSQDRNLEAGTEGYLLGHPKDRGRRLLERGWARDFGQVCSLGDSGLGPRVSREVHPLRTIATTPCFEVKRAAVWP